MTRNRIFRLFVASISAYRIEDLPIGWCLLTPCAASSGVPIYQVATLAFSNSTTSPGNELENAREKMALSDLGVYTRYDHPPEEDHLLSSACVV